MADEIDLEQLLDTAVARQQAGQFDLAEADYRTVLQHNPNEPDALNLLGVILQERGKFDEAIAFIARALEIQPDFPEALTNLARAQRAMSAPAAAADAAQRAIALDPSLAEAHLQFGRALVELGDHTGATAALRQAVALAPQSVDSMLQLGAALLQMNDFQAAADSLTAALALDPDRADAMISLGVALGSLDRIDDAFYWHEKAATRAPDDPDAHATLAVTRARRQDPIGSIAACRRALDLAPNRIDIWRVLAGNLASIGRFAEAAACYHKMLALDPYSAIAQHALAEIGQHTEDAAEIRQLRTTLEDAAMPRAERIAAGFAAGAALDRAGDYDAAFAAFAGANRLIHVGQAEAGEGFNREAMRDYVDWAIATLRKDGFAATADWGDPSELPVFIVGMPRSGTTLVEQIAASHSQVFGAGERKDISDILQGFDRGAIRLPPAEWGRDVVRQASSMQIARLRALGGQAERVIDKLPDNCLRLGQIAVLFPNARIIVCRRDPRDICLSCYLQQFSDGMVWTSDQTDLAMRAQETERLMDHWRAVLPLRMIEIEYETLVADLEGESRRLIAFLGLEWDPNCLAFHTNVRSVMTASYWQVRQPVYASSVGRWRNYRRHLQPLLAGLAGLVPDEGDVDWDSLAADPTTALAIAVPHHRARRFSYAEPIYRALLRRNPDDPTALHLLGLLMVDRGEPAEAVTLISRSLTLRPDNAPALADLARAQVAAGDAGAAAEAARRAMAVDPALPDAPIQLGYALLMQQDAAGAVEALQRATEMAPRSLEAQVAFATALTRQKDHRFAAEAWQAAVALKPDDRDLLLNYAASLGEIERFDEALATYRQAQTLAPGDPRTQYGIVLSLLHLGDIAEAALVCRRVLETTPDRSTFWLALADCEALTGHFDAAAEAYRRVLALEPGSAEALFGLAALGQHREDHITADAARKALDDQSRPVPDRIAAGFALGRICDQHSAYDEAFAAYSVANRLRGADRAARGFVFDRNEFCRVVDGLIAAFDPQTFAATAGWGDPSEVPVFIVGMPRSGTSLVEQIAASHPLVFGVGEQKTIHDILTRFGDTQTPGGELARDRTYIRREAMAHLQYLDNLGGGAMRVIDKMPDNITNLGHIAVLFPRARIVVCRRDLRDVGLSCFFQYFRDDAVRWTDDLADCGFRAREIERLLEHWRKVLPIPMLEIQYETLVANLESESRRLIDFLGLEWDPACLAFHETERTVMTASHWQVRQPLFTSSVGRWRHYRHHLAPLLRELEGLVLPDDDPIHAG